MAFVDTEKRNAGEVQQKVGRLRFSDAIRIGCQTTVERRIGFWFGPDNAACAVCAAWIAITGERNSPDLEKLARLLGIPVKMVEAASVRHQYGKESREQIADWLAAQGL